MENAKIQYFKCDILSNFLTLWDLAKSKTSSQMSRGCMQSFSHLASDYFLHTKYFSRLSNLKNFTFLEFTVKNLFYLWDQSISEKFQSPYRVSLVGRRKKRELVTIPDHLLVLWDLLFVSLTPDQSWDCLPNVYNTAFGQINSVVFGSRVE